jgi:hypothetical protein
VSDTRALLVPAIESALAALSALPQREVVFEEKAAGALRAMTANVVKALARERPTIALVGAREAAILNGWIGRVLFTSLEGAGPVISVRSGAAFGYRAVLRGGATEEGASVVPDRVEELDARIEALRRRDPSIPIELEDEEPAPLALTRTKRSWWRRTIDFFLAIFGRAKEPEPIPLIARKPPPARIESELERLERERADHGAAREAELVRRVRELAVRDDVVELAITREADDGDEAIVLIDLRGDPTRAIKLARAEADVCVVVAGDLDPKTASLARELATLAPHLWVAGGGSIQELATVIAMDPARIVRPALVPRGLTDRIVDERTIGAGVGTVAALRLALKRIDEALAEEEAREAAALTRIGSRAIGSGNRRRDETRKRVSGAVAGRTIRILENVLGVLDRELAVIREERTKAALAASSMDALKAEVVAVGPALRALRTRLSAYAESLVHEAMSELGPALLSDLDARVDQSLGELTRVKPARPSWPPAPRVRVPEDGLVAQTTLAAGEAMRADIRWADTLLRSLAKVKQRVGHKLEIDLERLAQAAHAEILDFEPQLGRRLQDALERRVDAAGDTYNAWLAGAVDAERSARAAARAERRAGEAALRDDLAARARTIADLNRALTNEMRS